MLTDFDKLILPKNISTISTGGKRRRHKSRRHKRRHNKSNKSRTRRRHY